MVLVGDFNPDSVIGMVDEQFGRFTAKPVVLYAAYRKPITPIEKQY